MTILCRHGLESVIMLLEKNAGLGVICIVLSTGGDQGSAVRPRAPFGSDLCMSRDINKERDFHRFGFQFAGVKCRLVNQVRPFTQESIKGKDLSHVETHESAHDSRPAR
jgi:hypothetical protein